MITGRSGQGPNPGSGQVDFSGNRAGDRLVKKHRIEAAQRVKGGAWVAGRVQNPMGHVQGAVQVDKGFEVDASARKQGGAKEGFCRHIGIQHVVAGGEGHGKVHAFDVAEGADVQETLSGFPRVGRVNTAKDPVDADVPVRPGGGSVQAIRQEGIRFWCGGAVCRDGPLREDG